LCGEGTEQTGFDPTVGKLDKLIAELLRDDPPREMAYRDISKVLLAYGWIEREAAGSHLQWEREGHASITMSPHGNRKSATVNRAVIRDVIAAITDQRRVPRPGE